jgi:hypothetical protein
MNEEENRGLETFKSVRGTNGHEESIGKEEVKLLQR